MSDIPPSGQPVPPTGPTPPVEGASAPGGPIYAGPAPDQDSRTMAMLAHLLGIIGFLGPLIVWLIKKDQSPFVDDQGKEALNFQLTVLIGWVIAVVTSFFCIGALVGLAVFVCNLIFCIMGSMKANQGIAYRYPINIRFLK
jgi:uncharacterized protein